MQAFLTGFDRRGIRLSDRFDSAQNQFTVGKVDIELDEPNWTPEEYTKIEPGKGD